MPAPTPNGSNVSGSDLETTVKCQRTLLKPLPTGKVSKSKRKSRAFKFSKPLHKGGSDQFHVDGAIDVFESNPEARALKTRIPAYARHLSLFVGSSSAIFRSCFWVQFCSIMVFRRIASAEATLDPHSFPCFPTLESWKT
ncbi:hypothetical protein J1N35_032216 [Gossypium stocksii]|uniref:Uncharacterized protein n=1 Tax=Gossypium stocksii TaxID=47602 RepID=A0A9D3V400_9ROSI|nr:hypothetical protein J1N35_032216 [Gossypium stocksii]